MKRKQTVKYYLAYGSNLNIEQMALRCPGAKVIGPTSLNGYRLVFRGMPGNTHATVEAAPGHTVPVLLWRITAADEAALDRYEGAPRYYLKEYVLVKINNDVHPALIYVMVPGRKLGEPGEIYYDTIKVGYEAAGFDISILESARQVSSRRKQR